nr:FmdE family protein [uncultured Holophaga sp.]
MRLDYDACLQAAKDLHGDACMGILLGTRMTICALERIGISDPRGVDRKKLIVFVEIDRCATDAIMAITGCRPGKRTMKVLDHGKMAATFINLETGQAVRVTPDPGMKKLTPDPSKCEVDVATLPDEQLLKIQAVEVDLYPEDLPGKPLRTRICDACGEKVMDGRELHFEGRTLCRTCAQPSAYYRIVQG